MGVPKFFRWMSERYPAISQLIAENRIPEFDCLYLDMNGIIHNCTHSDSDSATHRMTEDKMFIAIFNYIEHLFGKIKPQKLFFMAIDGVAPRAKMNQQRARRFRTALDAERTRDQAIREGLEMPKEDAFDSNCITPGTEFMARLTQQLKYFINKKVSEDTEWQDCDIVLSGHEVPGEGEHKIMEYIRLTRSQAKYDANMRHCLYGLDADLIMLGLLSHDPHFCLLREEVSFGRKNAKKSKELEHQNFFLMHLCIVREYLELEFQELKEPGVLKFGFDMEKIIDDFILMAFFVGNDFLPNLPNLHINEGALALMFKTYKSALPKMDGFINEGGVINLPRLKTLVGELANVEYRFFETENRDANWMKARQNAEKAEADKPMRGRQVPLTITSAQRVLLRHIKAFVIKGYQGKATKALDLPAQLPARDRTFVQELADQLHIIWETVESDDGTRHLQLRRGKDLDSDEPDAEDMEEAFLASSRIFKKYDKATVQDTSAEEGQAEMQQKYQKKFIEWKEHYYQDKFHWGLENHEEMRKLSENYVQGLQWVLYYYYQGVASWPWYYQYHYAPMISDVQLGLGADLSFPLGQPFHPYQQLMGVLPDRSKKIVPTAYHELMTSKDSPIIDFYPRDFELDMNGKKQEWEAIVKIPFIDEKRLLSAMSTKDQLLSEDEKIRNEFGVTLKFTFSRDVDYEYPSSWAGVFPDIAHCRCVMNEFELPTLEGLKVYTGLVEGAQLGKSALAGFPSMKNIPFVGTLGFHGVSVFQQDSRNESMIITLGGGEESAKIALAKSKLGKKVYVGYPYLQEAKVIRVSDELFDYALSAKGWDSILPVPHGPNDIDAWRRKAGQIERQYSKRLGIITGPIEALVQVDMLKGVRVTDEGATVKEYAHPVGVDIDYALQTVVDEVEFEDQRFIEKAALPIAEAFPIGCRGFFLGTQRYGRPAEVSGYTGNTLDLMVSVLPKPEVDFAHQIVAAAEQTAPYQPAYAVARNLSLNSLALSKLTSALTVYLDEQRLNLGLNLKFEAKKLKVLGYSRRNDAGWEFSDKAVALIVEYMTKFPDFIAGLQRNPKGDMYKDTDFYPSDVSKQKIREIQAWLASFGSKSSEKVPLDAQQLDSDAVERVEKAAERVIAAQGAAVARKMGQVPRKAFLRPSDAEARLGNQTFGVGDRVIYAQESGRVPVAARGTVVGVTKTSRTTLLDLVFDEPFMGGSSLGDRCSPFRGSTVPSHSVLNVSYPQVVSGGQAGPKQQVIDGRFSVQSQAYGRSMNDGLVNAGSPAPLRGSFRSALSGSDNSMARGRGGHQNNGAPSYGRGNFSSGADYGGASPRGSRNGTPRGPRGSLQSLPIRGGPQRGGLSQRGTGGGGPTHGNVPPPASLDSPRGGRGGRGWRGGSDRRGGRGRGQVNIPV